MHLKCVDLFTPVNVPVGPMYTNKGKYFEKTRVFPLKSVYLHKAYLNSGYNNNPFSNSCQIF